MNVYLSRVTAIIRRTRWRRLVAISFTFVIIVESALIAAIHLYGQTEQAQPADVIILLGPPLSRRVSHTIALWQRGLAAHILCTGGIYEDEPTLTQAQDCYDQLTTAGVPADAIVLESVSLSTEENALYARDMMNERGWHSAILVSDSTHLLRATWLFSRYGIESYASPVAFSEGYAHAFGREVLAFHWQFLKDMLRLPVTHISGV